MTGTWGFKKAGTTPIAKNGVAKAKIPPKQPQLHYCDVCKISCAGPQVNKKSKFSVTGEKNRHLILVN